MEDPKSDPFATAREFLSKDVSKETEGSIQLHHVDITCDGCEAEPIIGKRFQCTVCDDIDLCEQCMRALVAAKIKVSQEIGQLDEPAKGGNTHERPSKWISRVRSDNSVVKWQALQDVVPCLHPTHTFRQITSGPERAVVFTRHGVDSECLSSSGHSEFRKFLQRLPPSKTSCGDAAWIHCSIEPKLHYTTLADEKRILQAVEYFEDSLVPSVKQRSIKASDIDCVAKKFGLMHGKWMIFPTSEEVDNVWEILATNLVDKGLHTCTEIKISTKSSADDKHVLLAYTENYSDKNDACSVALAIKQALQDAGMSNMQDKRMLYKADVYTHLGIYRNNEYNLKPTIYTMELNK